MPSAYNAKSVLRVTFARFKAQGVTPIEFVLRPSIPTAPGREQERGLRGTYPAPVLEAP